MPQVQYNEYGSIGIQNTPPQQTIFSQLENALYEKLSIQQELIIGIENKLHEILDHRNPSKSESTAQPVPSDAANRLQISINRLSDNNSSLERILKHLSEII